MQDRLAGTAMAEGRDARAWPAADDKWRWSTSRPPPGPTLGDIVEPDQQIARGSGSSIPTMNREGPRTRRFTKRDVHPPRGALRRELTACLRTGRALRAPSRRRWSRQGVCRPRHPTASGPPSVRGPSGSWTTTKATASDRPWQLRRSHIRGERTTRFTICSTYVATWPNVADVRVIERSRTLAAWRRSRRAAHGHRRSLRSLIRPLVGP